MTDQELIDKYSLLANDPEHLVDLLLGKYMGDGIENGHNMKSGARETGNEYYARYSYCQKCEDEIFVEYDDGKYDMNVWRCKRKCRYANDP